MTEFGISIRAVDAFRRTFASLRGRFQALRTEFAGVGAAWQRTMRGLAPIGRLLAPITGLLGAVSAGGLWKLSTDFANTADAAIKFGRSVGLSVESYRELQFAADRSGVGQEKLNVGLRTFAKTLGEAKNGQGALYALLEKASPALLRQLRATSSVDEAMDLMADAMQRIEDPTRRAMLAQIAFGESGVALTGMLADGRAGLKALREEARRFGFVISEDAARAAEAFNDRLTNMRAAFSGLQTVIGGQLLPVLSPLIDKITESVVAFVQSGRAVEVLQPLLQRFSAWVDGFDPGAVAEGMIGFIDRVLGLVEALGGFGNVMIGIGAIMAGPYLLSLLQAGWGVGLLVKSLAGPAIAAIKNFSIAIRAGYGVMAAFNLVMAANPLGLVIIAIAAVAAAAWLIYDNWDWIVGWFQGIWDGIAAIFSGIGDLLNAIIVGDMTATVDALKAIWDGYYQAWSALWGGIGDIIAGAWGIISDLLGMIGVDVSGVTRMFTAIPDAVRTAFAGMGDYIRSQVAGLTSWLPDGIRSSLGLDINAAAPAASGGDGGMIRDPAQAARVEGAVGVDIRLTQDGRVASIGTRDSGAATAHLDPGAGMAYAMP